MGAHTAEQPKCLTPIAGHPLLEWQLAALRSAGIEQLALVCGYQAPLLQSFVKNHYLNENWASTNMVASLFCAAQWLLQDTTIVSYSDIVYRAQHVERLMAQPGDIVISYDRRWLELWSLRFEDPLSDAESFVLDESGRLLTFGEKTANSAEIQGQYMGLVKISPKGFQVMRSWIEQKPPETLARLDFTGFLRQLLQSGQPIEVVAVEAGWCEVDSFSDLTRYEAAMANPSGFSHDWRG